ncbi:MAG: hypothetical protein PVH85_03270 [Desulfobacterales bacterium]|jgi:hypothetical protein
MRNGEALVYAYVLDGQGGVIAVDWNIIDDLYYGINRNEKSKFRTIRPNLV